MVYLGLVWFGGVGLGWVEFGLPTPVQTYILCKIWFSWAWWHINHFRLFKAKSGSYIYIKYIRFDLVGFYGIG